MKIPTEFANQRPRSMAHEAAPKSHMDRQERSVLTVVGSTVMIGGAIVLWFILSQLGALADRQPDPVTEVASIAMAITLTPFQPATKTPLQPEPTNEPPTAWPTATSTDRPTDRPQVYVTEVIVIKEVLITWTPSPATRTPTPTEDLDRAVAIAEVRAIEDGYRRDHSKEMWSITIGGILGAGLSFIAVLWVVIRTADWAWEYFRAKREKQEPPTPDIIPNAYGLRHPLYPDALARIRYLKGEGKLITEIVRDFEPDNYSGGGVTFVKIKQYLDDLLDEPTPSPPLPTVTK